MQVGIRELRDGLSRYVAAARDGAEVIVTDHGKAVARLVPLDGKDGLESLIEAGLVMRPIVPRSELADPIVARGIVSDLVAEQRR